MKLTKCSVCGKPTRFGGLCERHSKAMFIYNESLKWREEDKNEKQRRNYRGTKKV